MLKKVKIKNFLSCVDVELELDEITALIGKNAAGKTNILKVIELCAQFATAIGTDDLQKIRNLILNPKIASECCLEFLLNSVYFKYTLQSEYLNVGEKNYETIIIEKLDIYINNNWRAIAERSNQVAKLYGSPALDFEINLSFPIITHIRSLFTKENTPLYIEQVAGYLYYLKYYSLEHERSEEVVNAISYQSYKQSLSENKKHDLSVNIRLLNLWHNDKEKFKEIECLLGVNGLGLINIIFINDVNFLDDKLENTHYMIWFKVLENYITYDKLSFGTQRVLMILLAILYDNNSTLLIEQPEDGIHVGLLRKLLPLCITYAEHLNKQLIIATHSAEIIDLLKPENIRLVKMTDDGTKVSKLSDNDMALFPDYMRNEGSLSEFIDAVDDE